MRRLGVYLVAVFWHSQHFVFGPHMASGNELLLGLVLTGDADGVRTAFL